jgi:hypothetical protein
MSERSENHSACTPPSSTPDGSPTSETIFGKTRAQREAEMRADRGGEWMEANRAKLDAEWAVLLRVFGD